MIFSDLPSPAEALSQTTNSAKGFAQAGNRHPPRIKSGGAFSGSSSSAGVLRWDAVRRDAS